MTAGGIYMGVLRLNVVDAAAHPCRPTHAQTPALDSPVPRHGLDARASTSPPRLAVSAWCSLRPLSADARPRTLAPATLAPDSRTLPTSPCTVPSSRDEYYYYALHTSGFITLAPPLPASSPPAMEMMDTIPETPALPRSRWSVSTSAASSALRSRWSSYTLSSIHSAYAVTASPKIFSFRGARCHLPLPSPKKRASPKSPSKAPAPAFDSTSMAPYANLRAHARPMGCATHLLPVVGHPPATPSVPACVSPDVISTSFSPVPMIPVTPSGQWVACPSSPPPAPALRPIGAASTSSSEALYAAYTAQRSPRWLPAHLEHVERERVVLAVSGCQQ
ncbi:hypothetical protein B0H14DRAFT_3625355 [Mycena olivaceomarginata]|nr:hypothetical protein B0H14DRAFT_3625355 [Mycena olivaceomarginata]